MRVCDMTVCSRVIKLESVHTRSRQTTYVGRMLLLYKIVYVAGLQVVALRSRSISVYLMLYVGVCYACVYSVCVGVWLHPHASELEENTVFRACSPLL